MHHDHLGSVDVITNTNGAVAQRRSYTAFGESQTVWGGATGSLAIAWADNVLASLSQGISRYDDTGHERLALDDTGSSLIHMNGRVYDPQLGRFLSADPHVQFPHDAQSYNRYSYVLNNPLSFVDPSGYFLGRLFKAVTNFLNKHIHTLVTIGLSVAIAWSGNFTMAAKMWGGFAGGLFGSGGNLKAGIVGALTAGAFAEIGLGDYSFGKMVGHGVIGGMSAAIMGGDFNSGFVSAFVTQGASWLDAANNGITLFTNSAVQNTIVSAIIGGTASVLSGGKFANGAVTAAFSRMFNDYAQKVRHDIAARAKQALTNGETYGINDKNGNFGPGTYKCNKFVTDVANSVGADITLNVDQYGNAWPPLAGTFGNPNVEIPGWKIVDTLAPGDIVAQQRGYSDASGHVGIVVDTDLNVISARDAGVSMDPLNELFPSNYRNGTVKTGPLVYRRYVGE